MSDYIDDHDERLVRRLPGKRRTPKTSGLARALGLALQEVEDAALDMVLAHTVEAAFGVWLDRVGRLVGEPRGGLDDTDYRRWIRARILASRAQGAVDRVLEVIATASDAVEVRYVPSYPADYALELIPSADLTVEQEARLVALAEDITPAGVGVRVVVAETGYFGFDGDPDALGFGEGTFAGLI